MGFGIRQNSYTLFRSTQAVSSKTPPKNWGLFRREALDKFNKNYYDSKLKYLIFLYG